MGKEFWNWRLNNLLCSNKIQSQYWKIVQVLAFKYEIPMDCRGFDAGVNAIRIMSKKEFKALVNEERDIEILKKIIKGTLFRRDNYETEEPKEIHKETLPSIEDKPE